MITESKLLFSQKREFFHKDNYEYDTVFDHTIHEEDIKPSSLLEIHQIKIHKSSRYVLSLEDGQSAVVLPLYGEIEVSKNKLSTGDSISVSNATKIINHSKDEMIECIVFVLKANADTTITDWYSKEEQFKSFFENDTIDIKLGMLGGREIVEPELTPSFQHLFYNVNGAFHVDGGLLDTRDAIIFNNKSVVEIESLSRNAVMIWIEMK